MGNDRKQPNTSKDRTTSFCPVVSLSPFSAYQRVVSGVTKKCADLNFQKIRRNCP